MKKQGVRMFAPKCATRFCWVVWVLVLPLIASPVLAQEITGTIQGTVVSPQGAPEPEVRLVVSGSYLQGTRATNTDRSGFFQFLAMPPGPYTLHLIRVGLQPLEVRDVVVELGRTTAVGPLTVNPAPIEMAPVVVETVKLDPVHTTAGGNLSAKDYAALPVDRDYKSLIGVLPMVNDSYRGDPLNVGGSTGLENMYYIDGVNVTDARFAGRATSLPFDFVRAVDVKTGGYEAQYGRALGGVVNAVTYSGTNEFESGVFGFVQPVALSMVPARGPTMAEAGAVNYDYGARLSGPVVRDRLWFSAALNPRVDQVEKEIPGHGHFLDRTSAVRFASKLTWRVTPVTNLELSVFGDPTVQDKVDVPLGWTATILDPAGALARVETGGTVTSLRATMTPNQKLLLQASAAQQWNRYADYPGSAVTQSDPSYVDDVAGTIEGSYPYTLKEKYGRTSLAANGTLLLERHTVAAGAEYQDTRVKSAIDLEYIERLDATTWVNDFESYDGTFHNRSPAAYVQDTWRVTDRIALNAGLRWSGQYLLGASGRTVQKITDEWQPRVGFVWQLGRIGSQRLLGSYGRFYQTLPLNIAVMHFVDYTWIYSIYSSDPRLPGSVPDVVIDGSTYESDIARIPGLEAENFDEFTLGYERMLGPGTKLTVRGMYRNLRSSFQWGLDFSRNPSLVLGTPGKDDFDFLPSPVRRYSALELAAEGTLGGLRYRTSYVLSRNWGNYTGLYDSDSNFALPGGVVGFFTPLQAVNSTGYLPNDRTHVVKLSTAYETRFGLGTGAFLTFESGAPVNDFAAPPLPYTASLPVFLVQRGAAGRTPALWNLDLRFTYELPLMRGPRARVQADVLHVGNPRRAVQVDERHYLSTDVDGNPDSPNPYYRSPIAYQPPMAARIGIQVSF